MVDHSRPINVSNPAFTDAAGDNVTVSTTNPLPVTVTSGGTSDVNLVGVNGAPPGTGHGTATAALRVELPTDGTGVVGLNAGTNAIGSVLLTEGGNTAQVTTDSGGALQVAIVAGGGSGGTSSDFGDPFPAAGTAAGFQDAGGDMAPVVLEADGSLPVTIVAGGTGGGDVNLIEVGGAAVALGQTTMAASLPVTIASNQTDVPVTGSVTANAGTDLNTSLLALEAGGNLAAIAASVAIIDDWDESDRAKTNIIVGQAGIAAGTGVDGATVPRVTLATNVPLPAGTNAIGKLSANSGVDIGDVTVDNAAGAAAVNIQDGGNTITVDGIVAATQSTSPWITAGGGTAGTAATGVVTVQGIASMTPVQVGDNSGSLTVDQPTGTNLHTVVDSGTITTVTTVTAVTAITNALPAGTNAIGKLAANSGVDIGDVDVTTLPNVSTASLTDLASSTSSAQLLAANAARKGLTLYNTDANGVYVKYGTTASATSFTVLIPTSGYWEMPVPIYTGRLDAIWIANGSGSLYATEL